MADSRSPRVRPAGSILVTRVRQPAEIRTADVTVLFADLRGYTGMVESLPAASVVPLFGRILPGARQCGESIRRQGVSHGRRWNHGRIRHDYAKRRRRRRRCAGCRPRHAAEFRSGCAALAFKELSIDAGIGIGLHLGEVAFGVLGPEGHKTTTLVGDTVNVAARLCSRARAPEKYCSPAPWPRP